MRITNVETFILESPIVQPDLSRCGGFTQARKIAWEAEYAGIDVCPHAWIPMASFLFRRAPDWASMSTKTQCKSFA